MRSYPFVLASCLLAGTILGAGIFSLPYVVGRVGLVTGLFYLLVLACIYAVLHRMYATLFEARPGEHQFIYLARTFLPPFYATAASLVVFGELLFVMLIYLTLVPAFALVAFGAAPAVAFIGFWVLGSLFIFARLSWMGFAELIGVLGIATIVGAVLLAGGGALHVPAFRALDLENALLPFGPMLFALAGWPAVAGVVGIYQRAKREGRSFSLAGAVTVGTFLAALLAGLFVVGVLRLVPEPSPAALPGLAFLPPVLFAFLGGLGLLTIWLSYFVVGSNLRDILRWDLRVPPFLAGAVTVLAPPLLFLVGFRNFLSAVSFTGGTFLALEGAFVVWMWRRAFPTNPARWVSLPLFGIFAIALIHQIASLL